MRNRRLYNEQLEQRAADLERERDEEAKRAVADERLRIAQELHDVVAHSMGVIAVQAGVGAHVIDKDPAEAKKSLEAIAATSRSTLTEIRRLLGVLRADEHGAYQPAPGPRRSRPARRRPRRRGLPVTLTIDGDARRRAARRRPHRVPHRAGSAHQRVEARGPRAGDRASSTTSPARSTSRSPTTGAASTAARPTAATGCMGMRERVGVYGGTLVAGPAPGGGFRVVAELPYGDAEMIRGRGRRRSSARARRVRRVAALGRRHRGRRRGRQRRRGRRARRAREARRHPHGHPHARDGRPRSDPPDRRAATPRRAC